jgi:hypothetical protein
VSKSKKKIVKKLSKKKKSCQKSCQKKCQKVVKKFKKLTKGSAMYQWSFYVSQEAIKRKNQKRWWVGGVAWVGGK